MHCLLASSGKLHLLFAAKSMRNQSLVMFKISELSNHQCQVSVPEDTDADNVWLHEGHLDSTQAELEISQAHWGFGFL